MKKKLEADLISIAHRILKLKGKEDVVQLHMEAQKLYEKLAILRFYEENIALQEEIPVAVLEEKLEDKAPLSEDSKPLNSPVLQNEKIEESKEETILEVATVENTVEEEPTVEIEEALTQTEEVVAHFNPLFELTTEEETPAEPEKPQTAVLEQKQISFDDLLGMDYKEPDFVKVNDVPASLEKTTEITFEKVEETVSPDLKIETKTETVTVKTEHKVTSLNDTLIKGINIGLNDRIAFVKHLFDGSNEDYNRVISQINTYDSFDEAQNFIDDMVKPDYHNWEGKEEYATRFLSLIEKKFN